VDGVGFERVAKDWRTYVERMVGYGNNAIAVPLLLELIDFDRAGRPQAETRAAVYEPGSPFRARHAAVRRLVALLFEWTQRRGMQVFLSSDMLALTPPLQKYLHDLAPAANAVGIDASDPVVWSVYRAGLEELFDELPSIGGVIIRIGEGGSLYHSGRWPYRSEMGVRDAAGLQAMLRGLLPVFEARRKTLVLRTWSVGVGGLGRLHVDPQVYEAVLGGIDSPALIISTKFTAGDFFSYLPLNPTLASGRHRRLIELQARPEFEGFGAFPNFLGEEYARALRILTQANPQIVGTYLWTQLGGPVRAGPRSLYPLHGFWLWTDANVFVASRLALDPGADLRALERQWVTMTFGGDERVAEAVQRVLTDTREAVRTGFYIRPFAESELRLRRLELPPLMWIFEWDMVGGWHSLLSLVYRGSRGAVSAAIEEGDAAASTVRSARGALRAALASNGLRHCGQMCADALRSLEYQETLFDALAAWRQAFLNYYRWLETGDRTAWVQWTSGRQRFSSAASDHVARFGRDLDFPAFDLSSATRAASVAARGAWARRAAGLLMLAAIATVLLGNLPERRQPSRGAWAACVRFAQTACLAAAPWNLAPPRLDWRWSMGVAGIALALAAFVVGALTGFTSAWLSVAPLIVLGTVGLVFELTAIGPAREERGRMVASAMRPLIPGLLVLIALIAYLDPMGFWYRFWLSASFRVGVLTVLLAMPLWTVLAVLAEPPRAGSRRVLGGLLAAAGAALLVVTMLLPPWVTTLRALDSPLNVAPATETMLFALRTYVGVSLDAGRAPWIGGGLLLAAGYAISRVSRRRGPVD
jgi:hypothetical protein